MRVSVIDFYQNFYNFDIDGDSKVEGLKLTIEVELGMPSSSFVLMTNGKILINFKTLQESGLNNDDMIQMQQRQIPPQVANEAQQVMARALTDQPFLENLSANEPDIGAAIRNNDIPSLEDCIFNMAMKKRAAEAERLQEMARMEADPLNPEYQAKMMGEINQSNIDESLKMAQEFTPEVFGQVIMLYIPVKINNIPLQAFVDSGAQMTIMSAECAERCSLLRLADKRFAGMALGVGQCKIVGRIHTAQLQVKETVFPTAISIIEDNKIDLLLGLDMLKRHQCLIDLLQNKLVLGAGEVEVPFLSEGEIEKKSGPFGAGTDPSQSSQGSQSSQEEDLKKLQDLGYTREQAQRALQQCGGNVEEAASLLFGSTF